MKKKRELDRRDNFEDGKTEGKAEGKTEGKAEALLMLWLKWEMFRNP